MIRFVASHLSGNGGTETVLIKVLNQLAKEQRIEFTLMGKSDNPAWLHQLSQNVIVKILNVDTKIHRTWAYLNCANSIQNDDLVISLSPAFIRVLSMVRRFKRSRYSIVSWIHFSLVDQDMFNPQDILLADYHWAISGKIKDQLMEMGVPARKISVIYNPIDREQPIVRAAHSGTNLAYVGRIMLHGQKNLQELFAGLAKTKQVNLLLVGTGSPEEIEACKEMISALGINLRITFAGWQNDPWKYLANANVDGLVLTSTFEGLPMVFLESIARGIPVISSRFDGYNDVVVEGVNGLSYEQGNIQALAKSINNIKKIANQNDIQNSIEKYYVDNYFARLKSILGRIERSEI